MSQSRARKAPGGGEANTTRGPIVKAAGDCPPSKPEGHKQDNHRSRAKNKLPKNVQYDLENALVSLCDLWFEDIKPHLVRNNIKLHVEGEVPAGPRCRPVASATCAHDDPGAERVRQASASCADCLRRRRPASRAPCHRLPAPPPPRRPSTLMCQNKSNAMDQSERPRGLSDDRLLLKLHSRPLFHSQTRAPLVPAPQSSNSIVKTMDSSTVTIPVPRADEYVPVAYLRMKTHETGIQTDPIPNLCEISSVKKSKIKSKDEKCKKVEKTGNVGNKAISRNPPLIRKPTVKKKEPTAPQKRRKKSQKAVLKTRTSPVINETSRIKNTNSAQNRYKNVSQCRTIYENRPFSPDRELNGKGRCRSMSPKKRIAQSKNRTSVKDSLPRRTRTISPPTRWQSPETVTAAQSARRHPPLPRRHESRVDPRVRQSSPRFRDTSLKCRASSPRKTSEYPLTSKPLSPSRRSTSPRMRGMSMSIKLSQMHPFCKKSTKTTSFIHPGCGDKPVKDTLIRNKRKKPRSGRKKKCEMFDNDLIDIIGKKNDKRLEVLYRGPTMKESCSTTMLNLYTPTEIQRAAAVRAVTLKPWR